MTCCSARNKRVSSKPAVVPDEGIYCADATTQESKPTAQRATWYRSSRPENAGKFQKVIAAMCPHTETHQLGV